MLVVPDESLTPWQVSRMIQERNVDKSAWGNGPWQDEPDHKVWHRFGHACLAQRNPDAGAWCGYVSVPPGHPWHGVDYDEIQMPAYNNITYSTPTKEHWRFIPELKNQGDFGDHREKYLHDQYMASFGCDAGIRGWYCRFLLDHGRHEEAVILATDPDSYWVGFHCGHGFEYQPGLAVSMPSMSKLLRKMQAPEADDADGGLKMKYRNLAYVVTETERLACQALAASRVPAHVKGSRGKPARFFWREHPILAFPDSLPPELFSWRMSPDRVDGEGFPCCDFASYKEAQESLEISVKAFCEV